MPSSKSPILFFDGFCHLCDGTVQFLLKIDKQKLLRFAPLQSTLASETLNESFPEEPQMQTVVLWDGEKRYDRSTAILRTLQLVGGIWKVTGVCFVIPKGLRDKIYMWVSKNRYRWFGKKSVCLFSKKGYEDRFL